MRGCRRSGGAAQSGSLGLSRGLGMQAVAQGTLHRYWEQGAQFAVRLACRCFRHHVGHGLLQRSEV